MNARLLLPPLLFLCACSPAVGSDNAGLETGLCVDGLCLEGLQCLSDVCVEEENATESGGPGTATNPTAPSGTSTTNAATTDAQTTDETNTTNMLTTDPGSTSDAPGSTSDAPGSTSEGTSSTGGIEGCTAIDFLFVVDNSLSMEDEQINLIDAFPGFIEGIQTTLESVDGVNVGVVTTDAYMANAPGCNVLGGLVTQTGGTLSSNTACGPYADGANYMTQSDDLATSFACATQVGVSGDGIERPMNAMELALGDELGAAGACNEGFLRDEALLVLVIVSDEWDGPGDPEVDGSSGSAVTWYDSVVAAKNGNGENVVVITFSYINGEVCPPPDVFFDPGAILTFTEMFGDNGVRACINGDFGFIFNVVTPAIEAACDNIVK